MWEIVNPAGERLVITLEEVLSDVTHPLGPDPGLTKDGVEAHLQELLAASPHVLAEGMVLVRREYPTDIGPVDLLCRDADGVVVAVEVKRRGEMDGVEQLVRYIERLDRDSGLRPVRGVFVAQVVRPQARTLAEARGHPLDRDRLRRAARPARRRAPPVLTVGRLATSWRANPPNAVVSPDGWGPSGRVAQAALVDHDGAVLLRRREDRLARHRSPTS